MRRGFRLLAVLAVPCLLLAAGVAAALELDAAKAAGLVGERADGYVGAVAASPSPEVQELVEKVNAARRGTYAEIAAKNGVAIAAVAEQAAVKLIERAPAGTWVFDSTGQWKRK
jgi:uncharacterized protein YdbL (DUF1318 family)